MINLNSNESSTNLNQNEIQNDPPLENGSTANSESNSNEKWVSFHCVKFKMGRKCDLCSHMIEKDCVKSFHFGVSSKIHGNLSHDVAPQGVLRWFVYSIEDIPCQKLIVGSTTNPNNRWSTHKSSCNSQNSNSTGLSKHFKEGCPNDMGRGKKL